MPQHEIKQLGLIKIGLDPAKKLFACKSCMAIINEYSKEKVTIDEISKDLNSSDKTIRRCIHKLKELEIVCEVNKNNGERGRNKLVYFVKPISHIIITLNDKSDLFVTPELTDKSQNNLWKNVIESVTTNLTTVIDNKFHNNMIKNNSVTKNIILKVLKRKPNSIKGISLKTGGSESHIKTIVDDLWDQGILNRYYNYSRNMNIFYLRDTS